MYVGLNRVNVHWASCLVATRRAVKSSSVLTGELEEGDGGWDNGLEDELWCRAPVTTKVETVQIHPTLNNHKIELHIPQQHSPKTEILILCPATFSQM